MSDTTPNRDRFLRLNPPRTEKAVKAIQTLAATGNKKSYEYSAEEAQACFAQIEEAAKELWEGFDLSAGVETPEEAETASEAPENTAPVASRTETLLRSKIDRAIRYLNDGNTRDALVTLKSSITRDA